MRTAASLLAGSAMCLLIGSAAAAPTLSVTATDNGVPLLFTPSIMTAGDLTGSFASAAFSQISVDLTGVPAVSSPDFGTVTLQVSGFTGTGTHVIDLIAMQTGLTQAAGFTGGLTLSNNNLIGAPGPTVQSFSVNGVVQNTFTFPATPAASSSENFIDLNLPAITSETEEFLATFSSSGQDLEATQEFEAASTAVREPRTLAILGGALAMLFGLRFVRRRAPPSLRVGGGGLISSNCA